MMTRKLTKMSDAELKLIMFERDENGDVTPRALRAQHIMWKRLGCPDDCKWVGYTSSM